MTPRTYMDVAMHQSVELQLLNGRKETVSDSPDDARGLQCGHRRQVQVNQNSCRHRQTDRQTEEREKDREMVMSDSSIHPSIHLSVCLSDAGCSLLTYVRSIPSCRPSGARRGDRRCDRPLRRLSIRSEGDGKTDCMSLHSETQLTVPTLPPYPPALQLCPVCRASSFQPSGTVISPRRKTSANRAAHALCRDSQRTLS